MIPSTIEELPFLVVYGAYVWPALAVALVGFGLLVVRVARRSAERRRIAPAVSARTRAVAAPVLARAEGPVTLNGVLRGGTLSTLTSGRAFHARDTDVWIDYSGERLELSGAVHVLQGSHVETGWRPPASTPRAILDQQPTAPRHVHRLVTVRNGDMVTVTGVLPGRTASVDRFGVRKWLIEPRAETGTIEIVALAAAATPAPMRWAMRLVTLVLLVAIAVGALYGTGRLALSHPGSGPIRPLEPVSIAAAMPRARANALIEIDRRLQALQQTAAVRAQRARLATLR